MSERNEQTGEADRETIRARADLRYLARTSPPIPDVLMQEAHRLIEADREEPKTRFPPSRTNWPRRHVRAFDGGWSTLGPCP